MKKISTVQRSELLFLWSMLKAATSREYPVPYSPQCIGHLCVCYFPCQHSHWVLFTSPWNHWVMQKSITLYTNSIRLYQDWPRNSLLPNCTTAAATLGSANSALLQMKPKYICSCHSIKFTCSLIVINEFLRCTPDMATSLPLELLPSSDLASPSESQLNQWSFSQFFHWICKMQIYTGTH